MDMQGVTGRVSPRRRTAGVTIFIIAVLGPSVLYAQAPSASSTAVFKAKATAAAAAGEADPRSVRLLVGRSAIVEVGSAIARVSLTSPDIADALVTTPSELLVHGKVPGTISMFVWTRAGALSRYEIVVQRDLARLSEQIKQLFPAETVDVRSNGKGTVLAGTVASKEISNQIANIAAGFVGTKDEVISLLQVRESLLSNQVLLRVRFAEVSRSAMTELGLGLFTSPTGIKNTIGRVTTEQFPAPDFSDLSYTKAGSNFGSDVTSATGKFAFSDFLNLFLFSQKFDLGATVRALQTKGLFQSLAEPNLVAESGKEASFLAGGEFPIPIAQASSGGTSITVVFKEFGIRLSFTPVIVGDRIHLKVKPEVSTLDFNNAVTLQGFRIPALSTRRTETELELRNGQTFAVAGLMNNTMLSSLDKIPGIGDIPILGLLFKSKAAQKSQTELVVMITPEILPNISSGVTPNLPRQVEPYIPPLTLKGTIDSPAPAFSQPTSGTASIMRSAPAAPVAEGAPAVTPAPRATAASRAEAAAAARARAASANARGAAVPAEKPAPASADTSSVVRPLTDAEKQILDRARKEEAERRQTEVRVQAVESRRLAKQMEEDRRKRQVDDERQARVTRAQAERDAEQAKKQAEIDQRAQAVAARREAEEARKQAEIARRQGEIERLQERAVAEAEARLKAAAAEYQAELAKRQQQQ